MPDKEAVINEELFAVEDSEIVALAGITGLPLESPVKIGAAVAVDLLVLPKVELTVGFGAVSDEIVLEAGVLIEAFCMLEVTLLCTASLDADTEITVTETVAVVGTCESLSVTVVALPVMVLVVSAGAVP